MINRYSIAIVSAVCLSLACGCKKSPAGGTAAGGAKQTADSSGRCPHDIKMEKCPFCNPGLIESDGMCGEHGVAEALCTQCRPYLKAAFRAKGDWCAEHSVPESQCVACNPELSKSITPGVHGAKGTSAGAASTPAPPASGNCEHGIAQAKCPFCTPSLIQSDGFCKEHNVAEALCVKCRPYMATAFKAKGDWCAEHNTPESQCVICNPELKTPRPPGSSQG